MRKEEDLLGYDFQGWPTYRMTFREMLEQLGIEKKSNRGHEYWEISDDDPILDSYPRILHDDGMGYGVNEEWVTESVKNNNTLNIFADKKDLE